MKINSLKLQNFRSYKKLDIDFGKNTIVVGPNAQGKTNLLEAIYLISIGKSFRAKETDMVRWGEDFSRIEADVSNGRSQKIEYVYEKNVERGRKTIKINGIKKPSSDLLAGVSSVFFTPDEVDMFFSFPSHRRRYINILISKINRDYSRELVKYKRVLEQRNALLKRIGSGRGKEEDLEVWDGKIADHGTKIIVERMKVASEINKILSKNYSKITGMDCELLLEYEPTFKVSGGPNTEKIWAEYLKALLASRKQDMILKATSTGPHRDNLKFFLDGRELTTFASRGEFRSVIIALKLSEVEIFKSKLEKAPILLLDDVFSELDDARREALVKTFGSQQTLTTTTDLDHVAKDLRKNADIYRIKNNKLERV